jgi:cephalosporin hydroxylase
MNFEKEVHERIQSNGQDDVLKRASHAFLEASLAPRYSYNFSWLGRPIIQYPQDMVAMQEIIWKVKPDLIIETGIAHGGSLIFSAAMLELIASCTGVEGEVIGIDIDIRAHNRMAIEEHPLAKRISLVQGSSVAPEIIGQVAKRAKGKQRVLTCLDSNHTHEHVLAELEAYAPLVSPASYCVVFDTVVEDMPQELCGNRPWKPGNSPKTAVWEYLRRIKEEGRVAADGSDLHFEVDRAMENKLMITVAPDGYLQRIPL